MVFYSLKRYFLHRIANLTKWLFDSPQTYIFTVMPLEVAYSFEPNQCLRRHLGYKYRKRRRKRRIKDFRGDARRQQGKLRRHPPTTLRRLVHAVLDLPYTPLRPAVPIEPPKNHTKTARIRRKRGKQREKRAGWLQLDPNAKRLTDYEALKHKLLGHTWLMELQYGMTLDELLAECDPLQQYRMLAALRSDTFIRPKDKDTIDGIATSTRWITRLQHNFTGVAMGLLHNPHTTDDPLDATGMYRVDFNKTNRIVPIVFDTGASFCLTPKLEDFVDEIKPAPIKKIQGISTSLPVVGMGHVEWSIRDMHGKVATVRVLAYYVPQTHIRLFSPQHYFQHGGGKAVITGKTLAMELPSGHTLEFPYHDVSNLPFMLLDSSFTHTKLAQAGLGASDAARLGKAFELGGLVSVADQSNQNLSAEQRELLLWHQRLAHSNFQWNQELMRVHRNGPDIQPVIKTQRQRTPNCHTTNLKCTACILAKQRRIHGHTRSHRTDAATIRANDLRPGDKVSVDQYESAVKGRLTNTKGKEKDNIRYTGGAIFVDHATSYVHLSKQISLRGGETLQAKKAFENYAATFGVKIKAYRADNHPFSGKIFQQDCDSKNQGLDFSGVGAHHQNAVAERAIQTITSWARAMMLHAVIMWPTATNLELWPFAMEHAVYLWNHLPVVDSKFAPVELFSGTKFDSYSHLRRLHVWGCPAYVLDPKLQDGKKLPKWKPRSRRGQYLGRSPTHASTVGMILNRTTGYISPQYHVVYDDLFTTVPNAESSQLLDMERFTQEAWSQLILSGYEKAIIFDRDLNGQIIPDYDDDGNIIPLPQLEDCWLTDAERSERQRRRLNTRAPVQPDSRNIIQPTPPRPTTPRGPSERSLFSAKPRGIRGRRWFLEKDARNKGQSRGRR